MKETEERPLKPSIALRFLAAVVGIDAARMVGIYFAVFDVGQFSLTIFSIFDFAQIIFGAYASFAVFKLKPRARVCAIVYLSLRIGVRALLIAAYPDPQTRAELSLSILWLIPWLLFAVFSKILREAAKPEAKNEPIQAPEPTSTAVTPPADAGDRASGTPGSP